MDKGHQQFNNATIVLNPTTVGSSAITTVKPLDMSGYEGVRFIGLLGASTGASSTATMTLTAYGSTSSTHTTSTGMTSLSTAGSAAVVSTTPTTGQANKLFDLDIYRPTYRYVAVRMTRDASKKLAHNGVIAIRYGRHYATSTMGSTTLVAGTNGRRYMCT